MKRHQKVFFPLIILLQLTVLVVMIARQESLLAHGSKVMLKCIPIDPRSLFSGDYVILNYEISFVKTEDCASAYNKDKPYKEAETVYVGLVKDKDDFYLIKEISRSKDEVKTKYAIILKGAVVRADQYGMRLRYGVESFFVPQDEGKMIEEDLHKVTAEISVDDEGHSAISKLFVAGKEVKFY